MSLYPFGFPFGFLCAPRALLNAKLVHTKICLFLYNVIQIFDVLCIIVS